MTRSGLWLSCIGAAVLLAACTKASTAEKGDASSDATIDAGVDDADVPDATSADTDGGESPWPKCPLARPSLTCRMAEPVVAPQVIFEASELGPDARFVAADDRYLLVSRAPGPDQLVSLWHQSNGDAHVDTYALPADIEGLDVLAGSYPQDAYVLGCGASECSLFVLINEQLEAVPDSELPLTFAPRGLSTGTHYIEGVPLGTFPPCVYGQGLLCFDGTRWVTELADEEIAASGTSLTHQAVVTTDGRVLFRGEGQSEWRTLAALHVSHPRYLDHHAFAYGTASSRALIGVLSDARTWAWVDEAGDVEQCDLGASYRALRSANYYVMFYGLTAADTAISYFEDASEAASSCSTAQVSLDTVVDVTMERCGIGNNPRLISPTQLWGTDFCPID